MNDEISDNEAPRDLLGDPVTMATDHLGRPGFEKNVENQETVSVLKAAGWSNERIARYVGCDPKTLRKHFSLELAQAADKAEGDAILVIHRRMKEGNVSAASKIMTLAEKGKAAPPMPTHPQGDASPDAPDPLDGLGKKERAAEAAKKPTGGWGVRLQNKVH